LELVGRSLEDHLSNLEMQKAQFELDLLQVRESGNTLEEGVSLGRLTIVQQEIEFISELLS
jgi:hypothetical protein